MVDICATWTNPCRPQMPVLADVARRYPDVRVVVLIDDDVSQADAAAWGAAVGAPSVALLGTDRAYLGYHDVQNLPTTFVYDASGAQVAQWVGLVEADQLTPAIEAALH